MLLRSSKYTAIKVALSAAVRETLELVREGVATSIERERVFSL